MARTKRYISDEEGAYLNYDEQRGYYRVAWYFPEEKEFGGYIGETFPDEVTEGDKVAWEIKTVYEAVKPFSCGRDDIGYGFQFETLNAAKKAVKAANEALLKGPPKVLLKGFPEGVKTTLEEFLAEMRADIDKFEAHWREGAEKEPGKWPLTLPPGDWFEQFLIFESSSREDS